MSSLKINLRTTVVTFITLALTLASSIPVDAQATGTTWRSEYFNNSDFSGSPLLVREDAAIDFNWETSSPAPGVINLDGFAVRWTGTLTLPAGLYQFTAFTDDGVRLWVNDQPLIDNWRIRAARASTGFINLPAGAANVRMEYFDNTGEAVARLTWTQITPVEQIPSPAIPTTTTAITGTVADALDTTPVNIRSGPGLEFLPFTTLALGQSVDLIGRDPAGAWIQVRLADGRVGWASSRFLVSNFLLADLPVTAPIVNAPPLTTTTPGTGGLATGTVVNTNRLNVRSGPALNFSVFTTLPLNQVVTLEGRNADGTWLQVRLSDGQLGWVSSSFMAANLGIATLPVTTVVAAPVVSTPPVTTTTPGVGGLAWGTVITTNRLNVRSGPGLTFGVLATLTLNQAVILEGRNADGSWLQVRLADGRLGWVSSSFLATNLTITNLPVTG